MKYDIVLYAPNGFKMTSSLQLPMGLMAISSVLKREGYSVKIFNDLNIKDNIRNAINSIGNNTIFFGISSMSGTTIYDALIVSKKVREKYPDLPIVWGGSHASLLPEQTLENPLVDIVVRGPGEATVITLAKALKAKKTLSGIKGITYKEDGEIISNPNADCVDINKYPMLDFESFDMDKYITKIEPSKLTYDDISTRILGYSSSRGCMHRCGFCAISSFYGKQWLAYKPERVVKELKLIVNKYKVNGIIFSDDNFFIDRRRVEKICDLLIKEKLNIKWGAMCRCSYFANYDEAFINKLKESGCASLFFGAESGSQKILDLIKKDIKVEDILVCAKKTRQHGIKAKFFFMMGFPGETIKDVYKTINLLDKIYEIIPETLHPVLLYTPYAKTDLMEKSIAAGLHPPEDLEGWGTYNFLSYDKPWGSPEYVNLIETAAIISQFLLGFQTSERYEKAWQRLAFGILKADASFRWKHKLFKLSAEWKIVKRYMDKQLVDSKNHWLRALEKIK
jgi:anaerobic magnesium-protoporphyrin IX monomethyl ester cyclase